MSFKSKNKTKLKISQTYLKKFEKTTLFKNLSIS